MSQSLKAVRNALYEACQQIYATTRDSRGAPVLVSYGPPGSYQSDWIVAVAMGTRQPVTRPTLGTGRSRERAADIDVTVSVYVPGAEVAQQTADDACDDLVDMLEAHLRTSPNERLGGACRDAWVSNVDGPTPAIARHPTSNAVTGRVAESIVTVTALIRY